MSDAPAASAPAAAEPTDQEAAEQRALQWASDYLAKLRERTASRLVELADSSSGEIKPQIGEPTVGSYVAFDVAVTSPIQFIGLPPYQPSKIIAAGEAAFIVAFMFVNPTVNVPAGFAVPPAVQLGGRNWRLSLNQCNLTKCIAEPQQVLTGVFPSPAPTLVFQIFSLAPPNPGPDPALIEANVTLDIVDPGQPYAAFATTFFDIDDDPGFLFVPPGGPGFRHQLPNRYLGYSK